MRLYCSFSSGGKERIALGEFIEYVSIKFWKLLLFVPIFFGDNPFFAFDDMPKIILRKTATEQNSRGFHTHQN